MFFYRAWAGLNELNRPTDPFNDQLYSQFLFHRWGYAALLAITLVASLVLNSGFVLAFVGNPNVRRLPHWVLLVLCVRDLLVTLILIPTAIDWFVVNFGIWGGGQIWCQMAGFFDFTLATAYPLILLAFAVTLYTRRYVRPEDEFLDLPMDEVDPNNMPPIPMNDPTMNSSRPPSVATSTPIAKPPSVVGSVDGYRPGRAPNLPPPPRHPFNVTQNRPGSVTGSIEGRLAAGRMTSAGRRTPLTAQTPGRPASATQTPQRPTNSFRASSPLHEADELAGVEEGSDLWDAASLDYPGRNADSPSGWDFMLDNPEGDLVKYHSWHVWLLAVSCLLSLSFGIPAALLIEHFPDRRPGCNIPIDPFSNPYSYTVDDVGFNFMLSFVIIMYMITSAALITMLVVICCHRLADKRFHTFLKMLGLLTAIFTISRSPIDIVQFKALIEAGMGFNLRDPMEIEYEIVVIWVTYLPLLLNPIVYFSFLTDYRLGTIKVLRTMCGCRQPAIAKDDDPHYKEEEILASKDTISKTQVSNIL